MRHRRRRRVFALAAAPVALGFVVATASPASAHEHRTIGGFEAEVGWGQEPTYAGVENSIELVLSDASGNPVTDLGDTLKVEVKTGEQTAQFPLVPNFAVGAGAEGTPGDYRAWLIPTRPGTYSFHFTGTIRGQAVDETFTSSETTFDDVADPAEVEFPAKDPTVGQISDRLDRETTRLGDATNAAASRAKTARDAVNTVRVLGIVAIVVALAALVLSIVGLRRRSSA